MIPVQNIYYMLSYAFQVLKEQGYRSVATETFDNTAELCAAILAKGVTMLLKRGLGREYLDKTEALSTLRGKLEVSESIKGQTVLKKQMVCSYDDFSVNTQMNRVIKSTMLLLLRANIAKARKRALKKCLVFFDGVEEVNLYAVDWHRRYDRSNRHYQLLMAVCWLVVKGLLQTQADGSAKLMDFLDEQRMCRLYEKFILEYYRKEHPELHASPSQIPWQLDDGISDLLPVMQSDITLEKDGRTLIIDAKYYAHTLQSRYDAQTLHSGNLYQIFTYVKNRDAALADGTHRVSGMLLYARTDEALLPDNTYRMSGNQISVRTLDLNAPFDRIAEQLDAIAAEHFS